MSTLDLFQEVTSTILLESGEVVFEKGEPGDRMFLIKEGQVEVRSGNHVTYTLQPGEIFGEMALISNEPRSATVVAKTRCELLPVDEERFLFLVQQTPYFSLHVMSVLAKRLRNLRPAPFMPPLA
jgi:CRP/FNR family cyclic AMP-dependent transcriptional regulator